jgi:hypothetical protein
MTRKEPTPGTALGSFLISEKTLRPRRFETIPVDERGRTP